MLRQCDFNFYGKLKATVTYNGKTIDASMYVAALGDKSMKDNRVLPEAGYPSDFDEYPDSLVGYATLKDTYGGNDIMVGGWGMSGSDSGNAVIMKEDGNKFVRINCPTSSKSHMFTNSIEVPQKQIIFEQNIRFNGNGCITLTSKQPYWTDKDGYTTPVTLEFNGTTVKLNGTPIKKNDVDVTVDKGKWYKIVLSADKTTQSCFAKVYDLDGQLVGETENLAWTEASEPTYYSIGFANKVTGTIDFDAYKAYYPTADASTYTLSVSQETLSIPNNVTLEIYDKNNVNKYTLPDGITFDAADGTVKVTSAAVPCVFTVRATGESGDGKILSRSVKVTVHGLSFDFGSGADESVADGFTDVSPSTAYTEKRGYGIESSAKAEGDLMLNGYGTTPGIVSELVRILTESANRPCVKIEAEYDDNGTLVNLTATSAKVSEAQSAVRSKNSLVTYWYSLDSMQPVIGE